MFGEDQLKGSHVVVVIVAYQECPAWLSGGGSVLQGRDEVEV